MKTVGIVLASFGAHGFSFLLFLWAGLLIGVAAGGIAAVVVFLIIHLCVVAGIGYFKAARCPRGNGAFAAGLALAAIAATMVFIGLDYGLSSPVEGRGTAPPQFLRYVIDYELRRKNAVLWMMIPPIAWGITSAVGYAFGLNRAREYGRRANSPCS